MNRNKIEFRLNIKFRTTYCQILISVHAQIRRLRIQTRFKRVGQEGSNALFVQIERDNIYPARCFRDLHINNAQVLRFSWNKSKPLHKNRPNSYVCVGARARGVDWDIYIHMYSRSEVKWKSVSPLTIQPYCSFENVNIFTTQLYGLERIPPLFFAQNRKTNDAVEFYTSVGRSANPDRDKVDLRRFRQRFGR